MSAEAISPAQPQTLGKGLQPRHVAMISMGGIIGAGLFVGSSAAIAVTGPGVIISYMLAGLIILMVMRMLAEMASAMAEGGSLTEYARIGLGHWAGFITGWLYWYFWAVVVGIEAIIGGQLLQEWIPLPGWQIGLALLVLLTAINLQSSRAYGEFEFWFASIKVAAIVVFIVIAASWVFGFTSPSGPTLSNLYAHGGFAPFGVLTIFAGVTSVIFALCGAEIVTIAAAETNASAETISRITLSVIIRIMLFYVLSISLIVAVVPWPQVVPGISPFATALQTMGIPSAVTIMKIVVLTAVLSCLNSGLYITSRVLFTLAAHGDAPQSLIRLNKRRVPARAILTGTAFGYCAVAVSQFSPSVVFAFLVNASGAIMLIIYALVALAQVWLRYRLEREAPQRLTIRMWFFPWASWAVIVVICVVMLAMMFTPDLASQLYASLICTAVVCAGYVLRRRYHPLPQQ